MMKGLVLVFMMTLQAHAATRFETMKALFDAGTPLTLADLDAAYAGRCFYEPLDKAPYGPDDSTGALLVGHASVNPVDNAGPAFGSPAARVRANVFNANLASADSVHYRYDDWSKAQAMSAYNGPSVASTEVSVDATDLVWHSKYYTGLEADFRARRSGDYILIYSKMKTTDWSGADVCYFYKQLK